LKRATVLVVLATAVSTLAPAVYGQATIDHSDIVGLVAGFIQATAYFRVPVEKLVDGAIRGMTAALGDGAAKYLSRGEIEQELEAARRRSGSVGIELHAWGGELVISRVLEGSPALAAGLCAGDVLVGIGSARLGDDLDLALRLLGGEPGAPVELWVTPAGSTTPRPVVLTRQPGHPPVVEWNRVNQVLVVQLRALTAEALGLVRGALLEGGFDALVLDLRDNGGGRLEVAVEMAVALSGQDSPGWERGLNGRVEELRCDVTPPPWLKAEIPIALLVNARTASAAELLAAALQDAGRAVVVGERTLGKGTVQRSFPLPNGGMLTLTVSELLRPSGTRLHGVGVTPDVLVRPGHPLPEPLPVLHRTLAGWTVGLDVLALQEWLDRAGYDPGPLDGILGPLTLAAFKTVLRDLNLAERERVSPDVIRAISASQREGGAGDRALQAAIAVLRDRAATSSQP
jgi:carboxyl-terminal processing protease